MRPHARHGRRGSSLVEVLIASTLLAFLLGGAGALVGTAAGLFEESSTASHHDQTTSRAMQRVVRLLLDAGISTLQPAELSTDFGSDEVVFQVSTGVVDGAVQWGEMQRIALVEDPSDPADGADNDGDGLVDEGRLVWTRGIGTAGETSVTLCSDVLSLLEGEVANGLDDNGNGLVDEAGFSVRLDGRRLWIGLTRGNVNQQGITVLRTEVVMLRLRNGVE